jgi:poly(A) polymerase Pap1
MNVTYDIENGLATWNDLFAPTEFFIKNRHYIRVDAMANNETDHHLWYELRLCMDGAGA